MLIHGYEKIDQGLGRSYAIGLVTNDQGLGDVLEFRYMNFLTLYLWIGIFKSKDLIIIYIKNKLLSFLDRGLALKLPN